MPGYRALAEHQIRQKNHDEALNVIRAQGSSSMASVLELKGDYEAAIAEYESMLKRKIQVH
jgi:predicted negative regulator of RcsB-dependent stress response